MGQSAGPFKRLSSLIFISALPGCFLNRRINASLMTLANKNQILWLELQWCLIIAAEAEECLAGHAKNMWNSQSQQTVGQSEPMTASAVRARASVWGGGGGESRKPVSPILVTSTKPGQAMLSHNKYTGQRLWSTHIQVCAEGSGESSLPLPRMFKYLFRWRAGSFLC